MTNHMMIRYGWSVHVVIITMLTIENDTCLFKSRLYGQGLGVGCDLKKATGILFILEGITKKYWGPTANSIQKAWWGHVSSVDSRNKNCSGKFGRKDCRYSSQGCPLWLRQFVGKNSFQICFCPWSCNGMEHLAICISVGISSMPTNFYASSTFVLFAVSFVQKDALTNVEPSKIVNTHQLKVKSKSNPSIKKPSQIIHLNGLTVQFQYIS